MYYLHSIRTVYLAKMKKFVNQEEVDKTLNRLKAAKQEKAPLTKKQRATIRANKKKGKEM